MWSSQSRRLRLLRGGSAAWAWGREEVQFVRQCLGLLQHSEEMNFNAAQCHCSNFGEGISPRVDCWTYSVESSCWKPCSDSCLCVMWLLCVRASFCGAEQEPFSSERRSCVKAFWSRVRAASPGASSAARCQRDSITDLPATIPPWDE